MAECPTCGDSHFKSERGMRYHHATVHDQKLRDEYNCSNCDETFEKLPSQMTDSDTQFCSDECMGEWMEENKSGSDSPAWEGGAKTFTCIVCGDQFERYEVDETPTDKHYCSPECFGEWMSENNVGENHPLWKEENTQNTYYGPNWLSKRKRVIQRDNYECQDCGISRNDHYANYNKDLEVHHKTPIRTFEDTADANKLSNLITLCTTCHMKREHN